MPRLVVVLPLEPLRTGDSFTVPDWPLHVTVVPPFHTDSTPVDVAAAVTRAASTQTALTAVAGDDEMFGRRDDVPVTVVAANEELSGLHRRLVDALRPLAALPDEPAFTGRGFRAHVTMKQNRRVHEGDTLLLCQIALVDMAPRSDSAGRSVLATFALGQA